MTTTINVIKIKDLKNLRMFYDPGNNQIMFEKDKMFFTISKNEIFPVLRGLVSATQRFYRRKIK